jgi:carbamoyltransferase
MRTEMDYLVIGRYLLDKTQQPPWTETTDWRDDYGLD